MESTTYSHDLSNKMICPECKEDPPQLIEELSDGDVVCLSCGLVVGDKQVDTRSEWRTFANDDRNNYNDPCRVGDAVSLLLDGSQLETSISAGDTSAHRSLARAQKNSATATGKANKQLLAAYKHLGDMCDAINAGNNVADLAKHVFKYAHDHKFTRGKPQDALVAGCLFTACRKIGVGRTFHEISSITKVSKKDINRTSKQLETFLAKTQKETGGTFEKTSISVGQTSAAAAMCIRHCTPFAFRCAKIDTIAGDMTVRAGAVSNLAGRSPLSIAATCIFAASHLMGEPRSSQDVADIVGVSAGTIKLSYRFFYAAREEIVSAKWLKMGGNMENLPETA